MNEDNEFHVTDFGFVEAKDAFAGFPDAVIVRQYLAEGSVIILDGAGELDARLHGVERAEPEYANHYILVSGIPDETLEAAHRGRMQLAMAPNYNRFMHDLERANVQLRRRNHELTRGLLGKAGSAAPSYVQNAERRIAELEQRVAELEPVERRCIELEHVLEQERRAKRRVAEELLDAQLQIRLAAERERAGLLARLAERLL
jgi:hypothetical protein